MTANPAQPAAEQTSLIEYPCLFPIKVMGLKHPDLIPAVHTVAAGFDSGYNPSTLEVRESAGGKYHGLTLHLTATSRAQLDDVYRALSTHPLVKVVL